MEALRPLSPRVRACLLTCPLTRHHRACADPRKASQTTFPRASPPSSMPPPDPRVAFRLAHGSGALTAANINGSIPDVLLSFANEHWLHVVADVNEAPWRSLPLAIGLH